MLAGGGTMGSTADRQVISYLTLRRRIGILGVLYPVWLSAWCRAAGDCAGIESSISAYYHTAAHDFSVDGDGDPRPSWVEPTLLEQVGEKLDPQPMGLAVDSNRFAFHPRSLSHQPTSCSRPVVVIRAGRNGFSASTSRSPRIHCAR